MVLIPFDLTLAEWPERVAQAGLNTIGLHAARRLDVLVKFVRSDEGQRFLATCRRLGLNVEYELHAMEDLLSREYIHKDKSMFRMDKTGQRTQEFNCCPSHPGALEIIAESALEFSRILRPTTHRYFYWPDDGREWCHCDKCRGLSSSEQALLVENHILRALRKHHDPEAAVCHIAYGPTLEPPKQVKPEPGIFLEFAPITRSYDRPFAEQTAKTLIDRLEVFDANLGSVPPRHGPGARILARQLAVLGLEPAGEEAPLEQRRVPGRRPGVCQARHPPRDELRLLHRRRLREAPRRTLGGDQRVRPRTGTVRSWSVRRRLCQSVYLPQEEDRRNNAVREPSTDLASVGARLRATRDAF